MEHLICDPNYVMLFHPLVSKIGLYGQGQTKMAHQSLVTIGLHLECASQTELVVELELGLALISGGSRKLGRGGGGAQRGGALDRIRY